MADVKSVINNYELRAFIIISTVLQICLIVWTYQRKQSSSQPGRRIVALAVYLAADFTATLCLGGIFHVNMNPYGSQDSSANKEKYLLALWAPFILLHLGGHSKMTAFSLEDNEFWLGHLLRFMYHELTAIIICILASTERQFRYPSIILFIIGSVKFVERILALKRGSMNKLRSSQGVDLTAGIDDDDISRANRQGNLEEQLPEDECHINIPEDRAPQLVVHSIDRDVRDLCAAYQSFNKYKGRYVDGIFMFGESHTVDEGMPYASMTINDAFTMMEMELSFAHDLFYTKTAMTHTIRGWIVRILSLTSISFATGLFVHINKHGFKKPDVWITYGLLIAALIFEAFGFLESLASNHTIVQVGFWDGDNWRRLEDIIRGLRSFTTIIGILCPQPNKIGQFDVLRYCSSDSKSSFWFKPLLDFLELKEIWVNHRYTIYVSSNDNSHHERKIRIIEAVRNRLEAERPHDESNSFLTLISPRVSVQMGQIGLEASIEKKYEEYILIWHIATHLCIETLAAETNSPVTELPAALQDAKFLSDYLLYLLAVHPSTLSSVTTSELTSYRKACVVSMKLYENYSELRDGGAELLYSRLRERKMALENRNSRDNSNYLLLEGYQVADVLKKNSDNNIWELLFLVWVDFLSYAALHSNGKCHAEQLGTGGQFLTYVWLFIVHFLQSGGGQIQGNPNADIQIEGAEGDQRGDNQIEGDKIGDCQIGGDEGDQSGDGQIGANGIEGDQSGERQIGCEQIEGDQSGDPKIGGDQSGDGQIGGDQSVDHKIEGDQRGDVQIEGDQIGDGQIEDVEGGQRGDNQIEGDQSGDRQIDGDQRVDCKIEGDQRGDSQIEGDKTGDSQIEHVEGGQRGDGQIEGDRSGDRHIEGDQSGDNQIEGDQSGDGHIEGDQSGYGQIKDEDVESGQRGDKQIEGDQSRDGQIECAQSGDYQIGGDQSVDSQIESDQRGDGQIVGDQSGDGQTEDEDFESGQRGDEQIECDQSGDRKIEGDQTGDCQIEDEDFESGQRGDKQIECDQSGDRQIGGDQSGDSQIEGD